MRNVGSNSQCPINLGQQPIHLFLAQVSELLALTRPPRLPLNKFWRLSLCVTFCRTKCCVCVRDPAPPVLPSGRYTPQVTTPGAADALTTAHRYDRRCTSAPHTAESPGYWPNAPDSPSPSNHPTAYTRGTHANRKNKVHFLRRFPCLPGACPRGGCRVERLRGGGSSDRRPP
jgi:hypothetical protein